MSDNQQIPGFEERPPQTPEPPVAAPGIGQPPEQQDVQPPPPPPPGYGQPGQPQYGQAPGQPPLQPPPPPPPGYGQPGQPQYGQAPGQPQYGQAPGQPQYGQAPGPFIPQQAESNLTLNWWLSAFFGIIPAAIFYFMDKGKDPLYDDHLKENMNFSLLRVFVTIAGSLLGTLPGIGDLLMGLTGLVSFAMFILAIMAAMKAPALFRSGQPYRFPVRMELMT